MDEQTETKQASLPGGIGYRVAYTVCKATFQAYRDGHDGIPWSVARHNPFIQRTVWRLHATIEAGLREIRLDEHRRLAALNEPGISKDELLRRIGARYRELEQKGPS